ncbi:MAG: cell division protein FtsZ [Candidatus Micrarchaeota archaeon]|nr:cell division protein FtsZ [Candidatus Micrarchaeota archaeon]
MARKHVKPRVKKRTKRPTRKKSVRKAKRHVKPDAKRRSVARKRTGSIKVRARARRHARRVERVASIDQEITAVDQKEITKFASISRTKVYVIGVGGSGSNTMTRMSELHIEGATLIATNTDAPHLENTKAQRKLLLGRTVTKGMGAGSDPSLGEEAAVESTDEIRHTVSEAQLVFVNCGLGGGTGTGAAPVIAGQSKDSGALTVAIVTLPFTSEGKVRMKRALVGLSRLKGNTDTTIVIPNDKLLGIAPNLTLEKAFDKIDDFLANATKGIIEMITKSGMVNLDFADLKSVLQDSGYALIGMGESHAANEDKRIEKAISETLDSPLLDIDISKSRKALVNIIGGSDLTLKEAENVFRAVSSRINDEAMLKWGARIDPKLPKNTLKIMVVMGGVGLAEYVEDSIQQSQKDAESGKFNIDDLGLDEID